eukprot:3074975-Amphidinium_carterae.1
MPVGNHLCPVWILATGCVQCLVKGWIGILRAVLMDCSHLILAEDAAGVASQTLRFLVCVLGSDHAVVDDSQLING